MTEQMIGTGMLEKQTQIAPGSTHLPRSGARPPAQGHIAAGYAM